MVLYTVTKDATLRVFIPVLDAPQHLQLHATFDMHSASHHLPSQSLTRTLTSSVFWLDRLAVADALDGALRAKPQAEDGKSRRARDILEEGWDLFLRVFSDGQLVVKALAVCTCFLCEFAIKTHDCLAERQLQTADSIEAVHLAPNTISGTFTSQLPRSSTKYQATWRAHPCHVSAYNIIRTIASGVL